MASPKVCNFKKKLFLFPEKILTVLTTVLIPPVKAEPDCTQPLTCRRQEQVHTLGLRGDPECGHSRGLLALPAYRT